MKQILFSTPMVQAILDGRKTMTRRVIKIPSYLWENPTVLEPDCCVKFLYGAGGCQNHSSIPLFINSKYKVGDILWVRETTWEVDCDCQPPWCCSRTFGYKADEYDFNGVRCHVKTIPSIFMPKEACRIFLRVTNVKVERLQEISVEDAMKEGIKKLSCTDHEGKETYMHYLQPTMGGSTSPIFSFQTLWNSINGKDTWETNPYVFVYEFQRIEQPKDNA